MSDYESNSPGKNRPSDLESHKTSGPTVVDGAEGGAVSTSPLPVRSEQVGGKRGEPLSHIRRGLIATAALMGSITGLYVGLGTSPSAAQSVASTTGQVASVAGTASSAAGGSSGTVGSVFRSSFTLSSVTLTTHASQDVTVDGVSSTKRGTGSTSRHNTHSGRP